LTISNLLEQKVLATVTMPRLPDIVKLCCSFNWMEERHLGQLDYLVYWQKPWEMFNHIVISNLTFFQTDMYQVYSITN